MNLTKEIESGRKIYEGRQASLEREARYEFKDRVNKLVADIPNKVFDAAQDGKTEVLLDSSPLSEYFTDKTRVNQSGILIYGSLAYSWPSYPTPKTPLKGTFAQVLHDTLRAEGIKFRTYEPKDADLVETYIVLSEQLNSGVHYNTIN